MELLRPGLPNIILVLLLCTRADEAERPGLRCACQGEHRGECPLGGDAWQHSVRVGGGAASSSSGRRWKMMKPAGRIFSYDSLLFVATALQAREQQGSGGFKQVAATCMAGTTWAGGS